MASDRNPANSEQSDAAAVREASGALGSGAGAGAGGVGASAGMCHQSFGWGARRRFKFFWGRWLHFPPFQKGVLWKGGSQSSGAPAHP